MDKEYTNKRVIEIEVEIADMLVERDNLIKKRRNMIDAMIIAQLTDRIDYLKDTIDDKQFILNTLRLAA
ncbi:hypothetical protein A4L30_10645 [Salmonella enterica subsp. enterica serovar Bovismorbificans]|nr:hypothetical protein [Salmonella enterica subsp. enterica serovar Bovismorbificans]